MVKVVDVDRDERESRVRKFVDYAVGKLKIESMPDIAVSDDKDKVRENKSMGYTIPGEGIWVYFGDRYFPDSLRTLAHELVHWRQHEEDRLEEKSGETGSPEENEANAVAGVLLRDYGRSNPEIFESRGARRPSEIIKERIERLRR